MLRKILAVVAGYLVMAVFIALTLTLAWFALGPSFAFRPGTTEVTVGWMAVNLPLSFLGAVVGGWITAMIGQDKLPVKILAGLILVLGLAMAFAQLSVDPAPEERQAAAAEQPTSAPEPSGPSDELSAYSASSEAIQPTWYNFVLPLIGLGGVLVGGLVLGGLDIED